MADAYEYLFYRAYLWPARGSDTVREFTAVIILSVFLCWHALTALAICEGIVGRVLIPGGLKSTQALVFFTALIVLQYLWFIASGRHKTILQRYSDEPVQIRRHHTVIVCSYVLLSFVALICASVFRGNRLHT